MQASVRQGLSFSETPIRESKELCEKIDRTHATTKDTRRLLHEAKCGAVHHYLPPPTT